jgi:hypothetical protein
MPAAIVARLRSLPRPAARAGSAAPRNGQHHAQA